MTEPEIYEAPPAQAAIPRGKGMVMLLVLFFTLPILIVLGMHKFGWHPAGTSHGKLLTPPQPIAMPANVMDSQQRPLPASLFKDKWSMVYVEEECTATCEERLDLMRRLQVSMDKNMSRIQRVLIARNADWSVLQHTYPDLIGIPATNSATPLFEAFTIDPHPSAAESNIYLVDPLGNLIMVFPEPLPPADIRKDLARLLAYAWAG